MSIWVPEGVVPALDSSLVLCIAIALDAVVGEARLLARFAPPAGAAWRILARFFERKLNRERRNPTDRAVRGAFVAIGLAAAAGGIGWGITWVAGHILHGWILEGVVVLLAVNQRGPMRRLRLVGRDVSRGRLGRAREHLAGLVRRDPARLDLHGVTRVAIEGSARAFNTGVVGPVFWFLLFGLPGVLAYRAANAVAETLGLPTPRHAAFGFVAARLADVLNVIPALLAGLMIMLAALVVPTANPIRAARTMARGGIRHRSVAAGWPVAAVAGALDLSLGGPRHYAGGSVSDAWIGGGTARVTHRDAHRMLYLFVVACLIDAAAVAALAAARVFVTA